MKFILLLVTLCCIQASASFLIPQNLSLGTTTGKIMISKTGTLTTASVLPASLSTYTATAGKNFFMNFFNIEGRLSTVSATGIALGTVWLVPPVGSSIAHVLMNPTTEAADRVSYVFSEPWVIGGSSVISVIVVPSAATSTIWRTNFGGYEK